MAAFGGIVAVPLVVGGVLGLPVNDLAFLVSASLFAEGIATFIQARGIGKVGARVACVMGTDFTFVGPSIAVGTTMGLPGIFGATILGSFIEIILSRFIKPLRRFFPPIVTGTVVMLIGLTLLPVSIDWAAGGYGAADYGSLTNVAVSVSVMVVIMLLGIFPKFGALIAIMPNPVLGGAGIIMFGMVAAAGIKTIKNIPLNNRNMLILAISLGIGLGVTVRPDFLKHLPSMLKSLFSSGISAGTITALLLNIVLKEEYIEGDVVEKQKTAN